ncbi:MAG: tyrosine-type recombinase/integrase [Planctomycetota bacterium]|nr:tyrosine-type recombinase/integrase [Planctomycetota bacterium]
MAYVFKRKADKGDKNKKWYVRWRDAQGKRWRTSAGYVDKAASQKQGERLEAESAQLAEGVITTFDQHRLRPIDEHIRDFIDHLKARGRATMYVQQVEQRVRRIVEGIGAKRIIDLDPVRIEQMLARLKYDDKPLGGRTVNEYITTIKGLTRWLIRVRRLDIDPLVSLSKIEPKRIQQVHPRRALTLDEISRLLAAAERRPVDEVTTIRRGKRAGQRRANVRDWVIQRMKLLGRERRLAYLVAVWTGLRRSEIEALQWGDLVLDAEFPVIRLRAHVTKAKRADTLAIHPQLVAELKAMRPTDVSLQAPVVPTVPNMAVFKADLKMAGIAYGDATTGYADFHSLRVTLNTNMAVAGVSSRLRQLQMRHSDPRLTEITYLDERMLPVHEAITSLPGIQLTPANRRPDTSSDPVEQLKRFMAERQAEREKRRALGRERAHLKDRSKKQDGGR